MTSGILLFADGGLQAQLGSGSGSGGAVGQGGPEIIRPGNSKDVPREGVRNQDPDSLGIKESEGAPGSGRPPDLSTPNAGANEGRRSGSGSGRMDSSGGTGSGDEKGSSGSAEGARR